MQHIKDVLQKVYERKERTQEALTEFTQALADIQKNIPEHLADSMRRAAVSSYEKGVLTLLLPRRDLHPDVYFVLQDMKEYFIKKTGKKIRVIKLVAKNPS